MQYALLIIKSDEAWERPSQTEEEFNALVRWRTELWSKGKVVADAPLDPPATATTVSWRGKAPVVTDGPYIEAKESVGGFFLLEVDSQTEAVEIARTWPQTSGFRIEIRRVPAEFRRVAGVG